MIIHDGLFGSVMVQCVLGNMPTRMAGNAIASYFNMYSDGYHLTHAPVRPL